jgi:protein-S-isoprenylcysteine O-methyltransferase Ste14
MTVFYGWLYQVLLETLIPHLSRAYFAAQMEAGYAVELSVIARVLGLCILFSVVTPLMFRYGTFWRIIVGFFAVEVVYGRLIDQLLALSLRATLFFGLSRWLFFAPLIALASLAISAWISVLLYEKSPASPSTALVIIRVVAYSLIVAAVLFGLSGRLDWTMAWIYLCVLTISTGFNIYFVVHKHPGLVAERTKFTKSEGIKSWDKVLSPLMGIFGPSLILVVCALDIRQGGSPAPQGPVQYGGILLIAAGSALTTWAIASNRFFSSVVRIQKERGHVVVDSGPYRIVRHPGYSGGILYYIGLPMALGSFWGLIPAGLTLIVTVVRAALEDKTLRSELEGYDDYSKRVRFRLVPGVW